MPKPVPKKHLPRPSDPNQLAKLIGDIATGQVEDRQPGTLPEPTPDEVRRVMSALGKRGGPKGGKARADVLSRARRIQIAKKAAKTRWRKPHRT